MPRQKEPLEKLPLATTIIIFSCMILQLSTAINEESVIGHRRRTKRSTEDLYGINSVLWPYDPAVFHSQSGGPIFKSEEMGCDFEQSCCWVNNEYNPIKHDWAYAGGRLSPRRFSRLFKINGGTSQLPNGQFLTIVGAGYADSASIFESCSFCSKGLITVRFRHWRTNYVTLKVCWRDAWFGQEDDPDANCVTIVEPYGNNAVDIQVPKDTIAQILFIATGFTGKTEEAVALDDVFIHAQMCDSAGNAKDTSAEENSANIELGSDEEAWLNSEEADFTEPPDPSLYPSDSDEDFFEDLDQDDEDHYPDDADDSYEDEEAEGAEYSDEEGSAEHYAHVEEYVVSQRNADRSPADGGWGSIHHGNSYPHHLSASPSAASAAAFSSDEEEFFKSDEYDDANLEERWGIEGGSFKQSKHNTLIYTGAVEEENKWDYGDEAYPEEDLGWGEDDNEGKWGGDNNQLVYQVPTEPITSTTTSTTTTSRPSTTTTKKPTLTKKQLRKQSKLKALNKRKNKSNAKPPKKFVSKSVSAPRGNGGGLREGRLVSEEFCDGGGSCSFEAENSCGAKMTYFKITAGKSGNRLTGIVEAAEGKFYASAKINPGKKAKLEAKVKFGKSDGIVAFNVYEATVGTRMKICCVIPKAKGKKPSLECKYTTKILADKEDRKWKSDKIVCPAKTKKVMFLCENFGQNHAVCGVDGIKVFGTPSGQRSRVLMCTNRSVIRPRRLKLKQ